MAVYSEIKDNAAYDPVEGRAPLILGGHDFHSITEAVAEPLESKPTPGWWAVIAVSGAMLALLGVSIGWLFWEGDRKSVV